MPYDVDEPLIEVEEDEIAWPRYFTQFREEIFPHFERQGLAFGEALVIWKLNEVLNVLRDIRDKESA